MCFAVSVMAATTGQPAPEFTATDTQGRTVKLSDFKGKYVVLEWTNPDCPFVQNQYNTKNMQTLQKETADHGVVWLSINSTNKSSREFKTAAQMNEWMRSRGGSPQEVVVDAESATARLYSAKTTPHMFIVNPEGTLIYAGAIDDRPSTRSDDPAAARNYVRTTLAQAAGGMAVNPSTTTPYGCSIKY
jgi:peroxiredoxin